MLKREKRNFIFLSCSFFGVNFVHHHAKPCTPCRFPIGKQQEVPQTNTGEEEKK